LTPRDVNDLRARLEAAAVAAAALARHVDDVHSLAYEKHVSPGERVTVKKPFPDGLEVVGDLRARILWAHLVKHAHHVESILLTLEQGVGNLLAAGRSAEDTRGSLISSAEFAHAVQAQRRRASAGDYTPARSQEQPGYPGGGGR
jgi:hypothetical protein